MYLYTSCICYVFSSVAILAPTISSFAIAHVTMPGNPYSAFEHAGYGYGKLGSIFASSLPHGCDYDRFWSPVRYGGYWQLPLNNLGDIGAMNFPRLGDTKNRPVGDQMRPS